MKIFITYVSAGAGHFRAAQALDNQFRKNSPSWRIELVDVLAFAKPVFRITYLWGYNFMVSFARWLWAIAFYLTSSTILHPIINPICFLITRINTSAFRDFLIRENPDYLISTHFLPSEIISDLKKSHQINSKLITVITDFGVHPFWLSANADIYVGACTYTKEKLILNAVKPETIKVLGIPIDPKFQRIPQRGALFKKFNLDERKFTVLIVTGSFGIGPIEKIVDVLHRDAQVLVVCARNKKLFVRLKEKNYPQVRVFGFIDNIEELMGLADIAITKPGGLSICEILAMELVPIFISAIPGQETENVKALESYGVAKTARSVDEIKKIVLDYQAHPEELSRIKENIRRIKKPSAAEDLYNVIRQSSSGSAS